jgi:hypothetical protein
MKTQRAVLAEMYIQLSLQAEEQHMEQLADVLEHFATYEGRKIYGPEVSLNLILEEGSLRARAIILGTLAIISRYGDFRSGVDALVHDAKQFSERVSEQFVGEARIPTDEVLRIERRLGTPGRLQRLLKEIDQLGDNPSPGKARRAHEELVSLLMELAEKGDRDYLLKGMPTHPTSGDLPLPFPNDQPKKESCPDIRRRRKRESIAYEAATEARDHSYSMQVRSGKKRIHRFHERLG